MKPYGHNNILDVPKYCDLVQIHDVEDLGTIDDI